MSKEITRDDAWKLLTMYNKEPFHLKHAIIVEGVMRYFARELGFANEEDFWGIVGLLHDLDFEQFPEEHCSKEQEIMRVIKKWKDARLHLIYLTMFRKN